jgi:hypothetical protein
LRGDELVHPLPRSFGENLQNPYFSALIGQTLPRSPALPRNGHAPATGP